jgi:hypothetical protein
MSWVRKGSRCHQGYPFREDAGCPPDTCPGSDVYVFENVEGHVECCMCDLAEGAWGRFKAATVPEMVEHLRAHIAAGHHVPVSLLEVGTR